jgi:hypothetical protein
LTEGATATGVAIGITSLVFGALHAVTPTYFVFATAASVAFGKRLRLTPRTKMFHVWVCVVKGWSPGPFLFGSLSRHLDEGTRVAVPALQLLGLVGCQTSVLVAVSAGCGVPRRGVFVLWAASCSCDALAVRFHRAPIDMPVLDSGRAFCGECQRECYPIGGARQVTAQEQEL